MKPQYSRQVTGKGNNYRTVRVNTSLPQADGRTAVGLGPLTLSVQSA
jgi:hypothetical protein